MVMSVHVYTKNSDPKGISGYFIDDNEDRSFLVMWNVGVEEYKKQYRS